MNKINSSLYFFAAIVILFLIGESCVSHDFPEFTCTDPDISFSLDVNPIINSKCAIPDCHNGDNGAEKNWTNFSLFQAKSAEVQRRVTRRIMPPSYSPQGPLSQEEINTIACWVEQGSQDN